MDQFVYPATLTPDTQDGGFVVTFVDVPEAITQGDDVSEALRQAADCLEEAMVGRIRRHGDIPKASPIRAGNMPWPARPYGGQSCLVYVRQTQLTQVELAARLHCDEKEVRRLLDPRHASKLSRMEALAILGQQLVIGVQPVGGKEAGGFRGTVASLTKPSAMGKAQPHRKREMQA